jgi:N6-adenosine-specific RNA methylase IME4
VRYRTIVADPPWQIERAPGGSNLAAGRPLGPELPYPTMDLDEIASLPVRDMAERDAHLWVWTISAYLHDTPMVVRQWGFHPSAMLVWCKPHGGFVGGAFYPNVEYVFFCRRGSLPTQMSVPTRWFDWPRAGHSVKPEAFLDLVEQVSPGPYLELFARRQRLGWDTWGDEALEHVRLGAG